MKINDQTRESILEAKADMEKRIAILNDVLDEDMTLKNIEKKYDVSRKYIRDLFEADKQKYKKIKINTADDCNALLFYGKTGAERLFDTVFSTDALLLGHKIVEYPDDLEESVEYLLKETGFNKKECLVYHLYFEEGFTLQKITDQFGLSGTRVRQIKSKFIRKMKHSARARILAFGLKKYAVLEEEADAERYMHDEENGIENIRKNIIEFRKAADSLAQLKEELESSEFAEEKEKLSQLLKETCEYADILLTREPTYFYPDDNMHIDKAFPDITVRTYNILKRADINTVADIKNYGYAGLLKIKDLRRKDIIEIAELLKRYDGTILEIPTETD